MTLAAAYRIGQVPVLLSDILVSGRSRGSHQPIATRVDLEEPLPLDWLVTVNDLTRKSIIICRNVAIAVAGSGLAASAICRDLKGWFQETEPSCAALADGLATIDYATSSATHCTLVGWIVESGSPRSFRWDSARPNDISWDEDFLVGSGAALLQEIAWSPVQRQWDGVCTFDHAQHYALTQVSSLLTNEITNGAPIQNLFGGGYDLLIWDEQCFRQGADVTFLFMSLDWLRSPIKKPSDPAPIIIRQAEIEDCLVIRALLARNEIGATSDPHERVAIVGPITSLGRQHLFSRPVNSSEIAHFAERIFVVIMGIGPAGTPEHWAAGVIGEEARLFHFDAATPGKIHLHLPSDILTNMAAAAGRQFGRTEGSAW